MVSQLFTSSVTHNWTYNMQISTRLVQSHKRDLHSAMHHEIILIESEIIYIIKEILDWLKKK